MEIVIQGIGIATGYFICTRYDIVHGVVISVTITNMLSHLVARFFYS